MEKLYVNQIAPDGQVSTMGLFYSRAEANRIVTLLEANPERATYRYEMVKAVRDKLVETLAQPRMAEKKE